MKVSYDRQTHAKAKAEKLALVTPDITGKYAKRAGVTYQGFLFTNEEVKEAWEFFDKLARRKKPKKPKTPR